MAKAVKLADIAEVVGVSIVTVSKALSGKSGVSDEVRDRIKKVAEELGYRMPSSTKVNHVGATGNIGVLIPKRFLDQNSFYWELYQRIVSNLTSKGYYAILEILNIEAESGCLLPKMVMDKKVDGVIALGQSATCYTHFICENIPVPIMFLDFYNAENKFDTVISDGFYGTYMITNHVIEMGHKEIGFVGTVLSTSSITDRYFGFCKAMREHGLDINEEWMVPDRANHGKPEPADVVFELPEHLPTAFVCNCDTTAYMVINKLQDRGLNVPQDVSVVGYDNYSYPDSSNLPLTTYDVGMRKMAETCVSTLLKKIFGESYYKGVQIVTGHMVKRNSVRNLNATDAN